MNRALLIVAALGFVFACNNSDKKPAATAADTSAYYVTPGGSLPDPGDIRFDSVVRFADSVLTVNVKLKSQTDSLRRKIFVYKYTIQRLNYRIDIVVANPSQVKFLKSWKNRINRGIQ